MFSKTKKIVGGLLVILLVCSHVSMVGRSESNNNYISNEFVEVSVNEAGLYTIGTTNGDPTNNMDDYKKLLYGHPSPSTSHTTIRVDGADYIYSSNKQEPSSNSIYKTNVSEGEFSNIRVKQIISIVKNSTTQQNDTVEIKYIVTNVGQTAHNVGVRIMMDTMLGDNDAAPFRIPGIGPVTSETEFIGEAIPSYWQAFDNLYSPSVIAHGNLLDVPIKPDKVQFLNWSRATSNPWNLNIIPGSPNGDSAVNIYWDEKSFEAGETREYVTYYGLSNFISELNPPIGVNIAGPSVIDFDGSEYSPNPLTLTSYVQNISSINVSDLRYEIKLPEGLRLGSGSEIIQIDHLTSGQEKMFSWDVIVDEGVNAESFNIEFILTGPNIDTKRLVKTIEINNVENTVLENIQVYPSEINLKQDEEKNLSVMGYYSDRSIRDLTRSESGTRYTIENPEIATVSSEGVVEAVKDSQGGTTTVLVTNGELVTTAIINVESHPEQILNDITIINEEISLEKGQTYQLDVIANYLEGNTKNITANNEIIYKSLDESLVKINRTGLITANNSKPGTAEISVTYKGIEKNIIIHVTGDPILESLEILPGNSTLEQGDYLQLNVSALYSDGTNIDITENEMLIYKSYDTNRLKVSEKGFVTIPENAPLGEVGLKATFNGKTRLITLKIISGPKPERLEVTPQTIELERGEIANLSAILYMNNGDSRDVTADSNTVYKSYDTNRVIVDHTGGIKVATNAPTGEAGIRVSNGGKYQTVMIKVKSSPSPTSLEVTPNNLELVKGSNAQISATLIMADGERKDVTDSSGTIYKSYDTKRVVVDNEGEINIPENAPLGDTSIKITNNGKSQTIVIKIIGSPSVSGIEVNADRLELKKGEMSQLTVNSLLSNQERIDITSNSSIVYKSLDGKRLDVTQEGLISIPSNAPIGETGVRISYGGKSKLVYVTVVN